MSKNYCQKNIAYFVKMKSNKTLSKATPLSSTSLKTYCLSSRKHRGKTRPENVVMKNKVLRQKSLCTACFEKKSRFMAQKNSKSSH